MKKLMSCLFVLAFLPGLLTLQAQNDVLKGFFDKEAPVFQTTVLPTADSGVVMMVFYFTHSKATALEGSVWIKDQGPTFSTDGYQVMAKGLHEIRNRQEDTVLIRGLKPLHFYTIGIDYRTPKAFSSKFITKPLKEGYRYEWKGAPKARQQAETQPEKETVVVAKMPCQNPDITVQLEPSGYCGEDNYPAVQVICTNCKGRNWEFSVEYRRDNTPWKPLRADGLNQPAQGNATRTEPLCSLAPGTYQIRVSAREQNCPSPVYHYLGTSATVGNSASVAESPTQIAVQPPKATYPDTCATQGRAIRYGNTIKGAVVLSDNSPCSAFQPFVQVSYVHPGYRDINPEPIPLIAGVPANFDIVLDEKDLQRGIHTIQVITYIRPKPGSAGTPVGSFWLKAESSDMLAARGNTQSEPQTRPAEPSKVSAYDQPQQKEGLQAKPIDPEVDFDESLLQQEIELVNVSASDPNCNQVQDLQLVYLTAAADKPAYISWMNPRCCQADGCPYTVWAGKSPSQLRLLVEGSKRGVTVKELLQELTPEDTYVEVVVKSPNGARKAGYVVGEGPLYGYEAIMAYSDKLKPAVPQQPTNYEGLKGVKETVIPGNNSALSGTLTPAPKTTGADAIPVYQAPLLPVANFNPCKYKRETTIVGEQPVYTGDEITIKYDYSDPEYRYSLYLLPEGTNEWVLAPGTEELQLAPQFKLDITRAHAGKYVILVYNNAKNWGCLSTPLAQSLELKVLE